MVHGQGVVLQRRRKVVWRIAFFCTHYQVICHKIFNSERKKQCTI